MWIVDTFSEVFGFSFHPNANPNRCSLHSSWLIRRPFEEDQDVDPVIGDGKKPLHTIDDDDGSKWLWTTLRPLPQVKML